MIQTSSTSTDDGGNGAPLLSAALAGCTILLPVDRRSGELSAALERHGAAVRLAPALTIIPHIDDEALIGRSRELIANPPDVVVVTTGVGFRGWIEAVDEAGMLEEFLAAIRGAQIVARGPKARGAIQQAGLAADWVAESETAAELQEFLLAEGVTGKRIAVQHHGSGSDGLDEAFEAAGADVLSLTVYRWGPPPDPAVVRRSVRSAAEGEFDAILFTSAPGAEKWLGDAEVLAGAAGHPPAGERGTTADGRRRAHHRRPTGGRRLHPARARPRPARSAGASGRHALRRWAGARSADRRPAASNCAVAAPCSTEGTSRSRRAGVDIMSVLMQANGATLSREDLLAALPRSDGNAHAVEVAVARVRECIGEPDLIKTVVKRGYRLNVIELNDTERNDP